MARNSVRYDEFLAGSAPSIEVFAEANVSIGTSTTPVFSMSSIPIGNYFFEFGLMSSLSSATATITTGFTGTVSAANWCNWRFTGAANTVAAQTLSSLNTSAGSAWVVAKGFGGFVVSAPGSFNIGCTRSGTSFSIQAGSFLRIVRLF